MQQLGETMTAQEFSQHYALELHEGLPDAQRNALAHVLAAVTNGPLVKKSGKNWSTDDFAPDLWAQKPEPVPLDSRQIMTMLSATVVQ